jgi:dTDP-4-amino-4,6-dideoxygalactose transaminase
MTTTQAIGAIPFNRPSITSLEERYVRQALADGQLHGDGAFTKRCHEALERLVPTKRALLTHSGTAALEMAALLLNLAPGDEVIMPSFTFVSTANAVVLRGATPVFVDVRDDTCNIDETRIEGAITSRTRAIIPVHYAGVACQMDAILKIAERHHLAVVEDAAQAVGSTWRGQPLGALGELGCFSFHATKNVVSGEGGALLVNRDALIERAEVVREKGTNRSRFFRGLIDKYTWTDLGSSYLPSELQAALLLAQLERLSEINRARHLAWGEYHTAFEDAERAGFCRRPIIPNECGHNAHMYYLRVPTLDVRTALIDRLRATGIGAVFHYVPLHSSPAGVRFGRSASPLPVTDNVADTLIRLPLFAGMEERVSEVVDAVLHVLQGHA